MITNKNTIKRDPSIDIVAGLMIVIMVANHIVQHLHFTNKLFDDFLLLFSFFMPWFFFKAGMFYKSKSLMKDIRKLFPPYVAYNAIGIIIGYFINYKNDAITLSHYAYVTLFRWIRFGSPLTNLPLWFLFSFFMVKLIASILEKNDISKIKVAAVFFIACLILHIGGAHDLYYIMNIPLGFVFFAMGNALSELQYRNVLFILSTATVVVFFIMGVSYVGMFSGNLICGYFVLWPVFAISGIIMVNNLAKYATRVPIIRVVLIPLSFAGINSMTYYVQHWLILIVSVCVIKYFGFSESSLSAFVGCFVAIMVITTTYILSTCIIKKRQSRVC